MGEELIKLIFTTEDKIELKEGIKRIILNAFEEDIKEHLSKEYLIDYNDFFGEISMEVEAEVKGKIKEAMVEKLMKQFEESGKI
jgi:hypothetical protein